MDLSNVVIINLCKIRETFRLQTVFCPNGSVK